ncbi:Predicted arabinose efflux permease, MFS family [Raineyella antarctica]|uniref:Predicted arabinose efflux permease, MFS family n=1 Tax=Raineyella antarctica TaxID=1577474 RepID=A0A1G6GIF6_9ACTN|nr:MFS transporter [Raineyella antarctica]SDB80966.1 Predicted arabinose efflux permease, MFS family [Raineyella antarctica]
MKRPIALLMLTNVLGGVGVASGIAVGALLVQQVAGTAWSGFGQALSVLGAAIAAVPLAQLAARRGRRTALATGYRLAALGAAAVVLGAVLQSAVVLFVALLLFGIAQATNLQTRYAGAEYAAGPRKATLMSLVFWATTIGSVVGPNLSTAGGRLGQSLRLPDLSGPYLFGIVAFLLASLVAMLLPPSTTTPAATGRGRSGISALAALRWAMAHPTARFAVLLTAVAHGVMVGVMSMTPVQVRGHGHGLEMVGLVISLHILGMYAFSPVFGWLADRIGAIRVAGIGLVVLLAATVTGLLAANGHLALTMVALVLLGLGWSASIISASALLAGVDSGEVRVPLQGANDALMNYVGAGAAIIGGPVMAFLGYGGLNIGAALLLVPAVIAGVLAVRTRVLVA